MYKLALALLVSASPVMAEPVFVAADRFLGVYGISEYGENDWNNDGFPDLAVIAISEQGDAVDVYLATSDPQTGVLQVTEVAYGLLPYDPTRAAVVSYGIGPGHEIYEPLVTYQVKDGRSLHLSINARDSASGVFEVSVFGPTDENGAATEVCAFRYVDIYDGADPPRAMVLGPDGVKTDFAPGPEPLLTRWTWRDLPAACLP